MGYWPSHNFGYVKNGKLINIWWQFINRIRECRFVNWWSIYTIKCKIIFKTYLDPLLHYMHAFTSFIFYAIYIYYFLTVLAVLKQIHLLNNNKKKTSNLYLCSDSTRDCPSLFSILLCLCLSYNRYDHEENVNTSTAGSPTSLLYFWSPTWGHSSIYTLHETAQHAFSEFYSAAV